MAAKEADLQLLSLQKAAVERELEDREEKLKKAHLAVEEFKREVRELWTIGELFRILVWFMKAVDYPRL